MVIKSLAKLDKKTLRERIYEEIVRLIVSGELPSGGWVDEKLVIKRLRVSRTPFREAIGTLAKGGLIEIKPYRGFFVRSFSRSETADLYELYKQLESFAVEHALMLVLPQNEGRKSPKPALADSTVSRPPQLTHDPRGHRQAPCQSS